jgi:hypothetical protein
METCKGIKEKDMKMPDMNKQSSHKTHSLNTLTLTGISLLWGTMLGLINPWFNVLTVLLLLAGYGNEITERKKEIESLKI